MEKVVGAAIFFTIVGGIEIYSSQYDSFRNPTPVGMWIAISCLMWLGVLISGLML